MSPVPPRVVVVGCPDDERASRASRLASAFRVPHLRFGDHPAAVPDAARGYVIDGFPDSVEGLQELLSLPADLVIHLRPPRGRQDTGPGRVLEYHEARGALAGFPPDADDEDIIIAVEAAARTRDRTGPRARLHR